MEWRGNLLYLRLRTSLYGIIHVELLWYETFSSCLRGDGLKLNPHDPCVANKEINGKQCTIYWHVDVIMIFHEDPEVMKKVITMIAVKFWDTTVHKGKKHTFLGIGTELKKDGTVELSMDGYIEERIKSFGKQINKCPPTPTTGKLFEVKESTDLNEK